MAITRMRAIDHVKGTSVSKGTRRDATPAGHEVPTLLQEYEELLEQKRGIEARLAGYSKTVFLKEQRRIRREYQGRGQGASLDRWIDRKAEMERERAELVDEKHRIESRAVIIKEAAMKQKRALYRQSPERLPLAPILCEIRDELRLIRELLAAETAEVTEGTKGGDA